METQPDVGKTKVYRGFLKTYSNGEEDDLLTISGDQALAEAIQDDIEEYGSFLTVRYFIAEKELSEEELTVDFLKVLYGAADADYGNCHSECTGYLWTDEEINVGGHDLLTELKSHYGKFCHLEITYFASAREEHEAASGN